MSTSTNAGETTPSSQPAPVKIITWNAHHIRRSAISKQQRTDLLRSFLNKAKAEKVDFVCLQEVGMQRTRAASTDSFAIAVRTGGTSVLYDPENWTTTEFDLDDDQTDWFDAVGSRLALAEFKRKVDSRSYLVGSLHGRWGRIFRPWEMRKSALGYLFHGLQLADGDVIIGGDINLCIAGHGDEGCEDELKELGFNLVGYDPSPRRPNQIDFVISSDTLTLQSPARYLDVVPIKKGISGWLRDVADMVPAAVEARLGTDDPEQRTIFDHDPIYCELGVCK